MKSGFVWTMVVGPASLLAMACSSPGSVEPEPVLDPAPRFTCVSNAAAVDAPAAFRGIHDASVRVPDDNWAELARTLPGGFAGIYIDNGKLVVNFVDPEAGKAALPQIMQSSSAQPADKTLWERPDLAAVRWNFAQMYEWQYYIYSLQQFAGMTASDVDEKRNSVTFGFIDEAARNSFIGTMNAAKVPCNLVLTEIRSPASLAR